MNHKKARADVQPIRQRTQYSCMATSMTMCLKALGHKVDEDVVNDVLGATPLRGAAWEQILATAQYFGCKATLQMPCTVEELKAWTDAGNPVLIAWNPEGRDWSHASVVFHVDDDLNVHVADPNIPNPKKTTRIISEDDFYARWVEKFPRYLVRRPACLIQREISPEGSYMTKKAASQWKALPQDTWMLKTLNKEIICLLHPLKEDREVKEKERWWSSAWSDLTNDGEVFETYSDNGQQLRKDLELFEKRGWRWVSRTEKVQVGYTAIISHEPSGKTFMGDLEGSLREAKKEAETAIGKMQNRRRPRWLKPA